MGRPTAWYPRYPDDFLAATQHLTLEEVGAYDRFLDFHFKHGSIPSDTKRMSLIWGVSSQKTRKLWQVLSQFFYEKDGAFYQKRMVKEINKADDISKKRQDAANKKWAANADANADASAYTTHNPQLHKDKKEAADAPEEASKKPADPKAEMWRMWVKLCADCGIEEKKARTFLGKQVATYSEPVIIAAVAVTCTSSPADPFPFLLGQLRANPKTGEKTNSELALVIGEQKFMGWAAKLGFPADRFPAGMGMDECRQWLSRKLRDQERTT